MINVTRTYLPSFDTYTAILKRAWDKAWITNNGELLLELESCLKQYLGVRHLYFCSNGTIVLQMALKAFGIRGEVITTPFSYVATTSAILWEGCTPVFVDINPKDFCIDADKIEASITKNTKAIFATHVYGYPCDVKKIAAIADKYNLQVVYDGAHAFGCRLDNESLLKFGDISTCSFHATKLFHTVEGGCIITNNDELAHQIMLYRQFGHVNDDHFSIGINGKNSEFHAAMGLSVLPKIDELIARRKEISDYYDEVLTADIIRPKSAQPDFVYNYSYYPVVFKSEQTLLETKESLFKNGVNTRRYFYPSLNELPYLEAAAPCPVSEDISRRVLCLPSYFDLDKTDQDKIASVINNC